MTIAVPAGVADATKLQLIADIETALGRIAEERKVGLSVRSRSVGKRKTKRPVPAAAVANPLLGEPGSRRVPPMSGTVEQFIGHWKGLARTGFITSLDGRRRFALRRAA